MDLIAVLICRDLVRIGNATDCAFRFRGDKLKVNVSVRQLIEVPGLEVKCLLLKDDAVKQR